MKFGSMPLMVLTMLLFAGSTAAQPQGSVSSSMFHDAGFTVSGGIGVMNTGRNLVNIDRGDELAGFTMYDVDGLTTGGRVSQDQVDAYQHRREKYLACPKCIVKQPFPGK